MAETGSGWDAYSEGMQRGWDFRFSGENMRTFEHLSGDHNPIHTDAAFAKAKGFDAPLVFGLLLASQISRLIGQELPDNHAILTGITMNFISPAFADEDLRFDAELVNKSDATHALGFKCRITRAGKTLCRGTADAVWRA
jgi:acyl dehydratase